MLLVHYCRSRGYFYITYYFLFSFPFESSEQKMPKKKQTNEKIASNTQYVATTCFRIKKGGALRFVYRVQAQAHLLLV